MSEVEKLNESWVLFKGAFSTAYKVEDSRSDVSSANQELVLIDDKVYSFKEDPNDGYRSCCFDVEIVERPKDAIFSFEAFPQKLYARYGRLIMDIEYSGEMFDGLALYLNETDDVPVCKFGTDNVDDYYPCYMTYIDVERINQT